MDDIKVFGIMLMCMYDVCCMLYTLLSTSHAEYKGIRINNKKLNNGSS